jgi:hypothetical protein
MPSDQESGSAHTVHPVEGQQTLTEKQEKDLEGKLRFTCWGLAALLVVGLVIAVIQGSWQARAAASLWALACLSIGYVVGFLFAVPRVPRTSGSSNTGVEGQTSDKQDSSTNAYPVSGALGVNTNLTEISDWLTKILVGLGLVELRNVPDYLRRIGEYVGKSLQCGGAVCPGNGVDSAASGLVLYFLGLGFLSGYLLTRLFLGPAFWLADRATTTGTSDGIAREEATSIARRAAREEADVSSVVGTAMEELTRRPLQEGAIDRLIGELTNYRERYPLKRKLAIVLARLYAEGEKRMNEAIEVLQSFIRSKTAAKQIDGDVADALFNLACYDSLKMEVLAGNERNACGERALDALMRSIQIAPQNAKDVDTDPDLKTLRDSEDFGPRLRQMLNTGPK